MGSDVSQQIPELEEDIWLLIMSFSTPLCVLALECTNRQFQALCTKPNTQKILSRFLPKAFFPNDPCKTRILRYTKMEQMKAFPTTLTSPACTFVKFNNYVKQEQIALPQLRNDCYDGIASAHRGELWLILLGLHSPNKQIRKQQKRDDRQEYLALRNTLTQLPQIRNHDDECIDKDIPRLIFMEHVDHPSPGHTQILYNVFHSLARLPTFRLYSGMPNIALTFLITFYEGYYGPLDSEIGFQPMQQKWIDKIESELFCLLKYQFMVFDAMGHNHNILQGLMSQLTAESDYLLMSQVTRLVYLVDNAEWEAIRDCQFLYDCLFCYELESHRVDSFQFFCQSYVKVKKSHRPPDLKPDEWSADYYTGHKSNQFCEALTLMKESEQFGLAHKPMNPSPSSSFFPW